MRPEEMFPENNYEKEYPYLETDFVATECTENEFKMKLLRKELNNNPDPNGTIDLESLYGKYGKYKDYAERNEETGQLQQGLIEACGSGDKEKIEELKTTYISRFPDQIGEVLTLLSFPEYLDNQQIKNSLCGKRDALACEVNELKDQRSMAEEGTAEHKKLTEMIRDKCGQAGEIDAQIIEKIEGLSAFQNRTCNLVKNHVEQENLMGNFWSLLRDIAAAKDNIKRTSFTEKDLPPNSKAMEMAKAAIIGQVTATLALENNGFDFTNPTPGEDFKGIDGCITNKATGAIIPIQVMARPWGRELRIEKISQKVDLSSPQADARDPEEPKDGSLKPNNGPQTASGQFQSDGSKKQEIGIREQAQKSGPKIRESAIHENNNLLEIQNSAPNKQISSEEARKSKPEYIRKNVHSKGKSFGKYLVEFAKEHQIGYIEGIVMCMPRDSGSYTTGKPTEICDVTVGNLMDKLLGIEPPSASEIKITPAPAAEAAG